MSWSFRIGTIAGTEVKVHGTFVLLLAFAGWSGWQRGGSSAAIEAVVVLVALFACVLLHEFGHVAAARRYGVRTPDILLLPIGGLARLERMPEEPKQEFVIAIAGPIVTAVIAALAYAAIRLTGDVPPALLDDRPGLRLIGEIWRVNVALLLFNLLPAFPMDGGRLLRALLASRMGLERGTRIAASVGQGIAVFLGVFAAMNGMLMLGLVAVFVFLAAGSEAKSVKERKVLRGGTAATFMVREFRSLPVHGTLQQAIDLLVSTDQRDIPVVDHTGALAGLLTRDTLIRALHSGGVTAEIAQAMHTALPRIGLDVAIEGAVTAMQQAGLRAVPVLDADGRVAGLLTLDNVMDALLIAEAAPGNAR